MTHPHDFALLCDLLDGRLAPRAEEEVRRRLEEEPALRAEWDDLRRMRSAVRALEPPPLPADFASRVRVAAGVSDAASSPAADDSVLPSEGARTEAESPGPSSAAPSEPRTVARVLPMRRFAFAAAAVLVLGFGVGFLISRPDGRPEPGETTETARRDAITDARVPRGSLEETRAKEGAPADAGALGASPAMTPAPAPVLDGARTREIPVAPPPVAGTSPRPFGPPGAIPPNLRTPSDDPLQPHAPAPPPADRVPAATPAERPAYGEKAGAPDASLAKEGTAQRTADLGWAFAGVDDVLVVEASGYDEGRARVALLLADLRERTARHGEAGESPPKNEAEADDKRKTTGSTLEKRDAAKDAGKDEGKDAPGKDQAEESAEAKPDPAWRRLSRASAPRDADEQAAALRRAVDSERARAADAARMGYAKAPAPDPAAAAPALPLPAPEGAPAAGVPAQGPPAEGLPAEGGLLPGAGGRSSPDPARASAPEATLGTFVLTLTREEAAHFDRILLPAEPPDAAKLDERRAEAPAARGAERAGERLVRVVVVPSSPAR